MALIRVRTDVGPDNTVTVHVPPDWEATQVTVTVERADDNGNLTFQPRNERESALWREQQAFIATHYELMQTHLGKYVAIRHGEVTDSDADRVALWDRMEARYADRIFYITKVGARAFPVAKVWSPRIAES